MEIWKDVIGYEGIYQVSNFGRVKSLIYSKKILKNNNCTNGYLFVNLFKDKKIKTALIHRIVYEAFTGVRSNRFYVIDHIDNDKTNNNLENLQFISQRENSTKDKNGLTGESNVYFNSNAYLIRLRINGKKYSLGTKKTIDSAVKLRDEFIKHELPKLNGYAQNEILSFMKQYKKNVKCVPY